MHKPTYDSSILRALVPMAVAMLIVAAAYHLLHMYP